MAKYRFEIDITVKEAELLELNARVKDTTDRIVEDPDEWDENDLISAISEEVAEVTGIRSTRVDD